MYHGDILIKSGGIMLTYLRVMLIITLTTILSTAAMSAPLSGTYNVGSGQTYTTLTGASGFFNAVNVNGLSGNVIVNITSGITETGTVALNQWSGTYTIKIQPSAATLRTISGNIAAAMINIAGADRVTIDGRFGGSGMYLRFVNSNTGGQTFRFYNDATYDTIRYCQVDGMRVASNSGIIDISTTSGTTGNDYITISNCKITDASGGTLQNAIVSNGTTSGGKYNNNITISNNEIYNVYREGQSCAGILLIGGSTDFTITGNHFYQTATRTPSLSTVYNVICVNTSVANNLNISSNYIGGGAVNCGGTAWTIAGSATNAMYLIRFASAGTSGTSNIQGNTIRNINFTSNPSSNGVIYFAGILIESGLVNIGTTSGNVIGNTTSTGNIVLNYNGTTDNLINRGIEHRGTGNIENNTIGSISLAGNNNKTVRLECIYYYGVPSSDISISNNTVGSTTTANSIQQTSSTFACQITGINSYVNTVNVTANANTISNMRVTSNSADSRMRGIYQVRSTSGNPIFTNNTISKLYCAGGSTNRFPDQTGLIALFTGSSATSQQVSGNTISGLYGTDNSDSYVQGFGFYNNVAKGVFEKNRIYDLNHSSTSGSPKIWAVNAFWGSWSFYNNQISVTNGETTDNTELNNPETQSRTTVSNHTEEPAPVAPEMVSAFAKEVTAPDSRADVKPAGNFTDLTTNGVEIKGIHDEAEFPCLYYYNSIYIGGSTSTGSASSWAYDRPLLDWATSTSLRNNILFNARIGGSGFHYAFGNEVGTENWTNTSSDYNVYIAPNSNAVAVWGSTNLTIQGWRDSSLGDKHTWSTTNSVISATSLFSNVTTGNLTINTGNWQAWIVSGKGLAIAGQTTDYNGNSRPAAVTSGCSDIGAYEFTATPPSNPTATVDNAPGSGVTSTYTLWGRTLMQINWGTGGSSYPSSVAVRYYSGVNHSGVVGGGYSNSYWQVTPTGTLTGALYNITINFGQNETYTIGTPSSNTRLAKYNGTWEVFSTAGTGTWQTELNWASETIKTRDMNSFSDYALTDQSNPLPVEMCSFTGFASSRQVDLSWTTCSEVNNRGFEIERRIYNSAITSYNGWEKAGFVEGHGTTSQQQSYSYSDRKLASGKYQYRIKQVDFNGNFEYHNLTSPNELVIGNPKSADLFQNYPNPSNPTSKVDFQIPFSAKVTLKVYDITGKEVASLLEKDLESGFYTAEFNGSNLSSGVYFYRINAVSPDGNNFNKTMKLILVK